jgi:hypothetical protein
MSRLYFSPGHVDQAAFYFLSGIEQERRSTISVYLLLPLTFLPTFT